MFQKGIYDPKYRDQDLFDMITDDLKYAADKLGIPWKEPPSD